MIEFPGLWGLHFNINPIALQIGNLTIYWYGVIIAVGFILAIFLGMRKSKEFGIAPDNIIDMVLFAAPAAIICARLYYVVFKWEDYKDNPVEIIKTWHGGLAIYGGVLGAILVAYLFARYKKIDALNLFDFCVPYLVLAQAIGRWGNFVNQEAYGTNTTLPWGMTSTKIQEELGKMNIPGVDPNFPVHPTFLYESLWNLLVFGLLIFYRKRKKKDGEVFFAYLILYGIGRFFIEGLRTDSLMLGSNIRASQLVAILLVVASAVILILRRRKSKEEEPVIGTSEYGKVLRELRNDVDDNKADNEIACNTDEEVHEESKNPEEEKINPDADDSKADNEIACCADEQVVHEESKNPLEQKKDAPSDIKGKKKNRSKN